MDVSDLLLVGAEVGYMFTRLLVRPLWKVVHEQEAADPKVVGPG